MHKQTASDRREVRSLGKRTIRQEEQAAPCTAEPNEGTNVPTKKSMKKQGIRGPSSLIGLCAPRVRELQLWYNDSSTTA